MQEREISYNVGTKDISNGLVDFEILSSTDYFILLKAPTNANLTLKLNSNTNQPIPLKEGFQVEFKNVGKLYLSCDAVEGESIVWGQSDGNLIIKPNPTINAIDTVTEIHQFNDILLTQLDKIINPYITETLLNLDFIGDNSAVNILSINNCDFDSLECIFSAIDLNYSISSINVGINGVLCFRQTVTYGSYDGYYKGHSPFTNPTFKDLKGKNIVISATGHICCNILKLTKKV